MKRRYLDWKSWLKGIVTAVVSGVASTGTTWMSMNMADGLGFQVPQLNFNALGIICLSSALFSLFTALKQSPFPPECEEEEEEKA